MTKEKSEELWSKKSNQLPLISLKPPKAVRNLTKFEEMLN